MATSNTNKQITIDLPDDVKIALERKAKGQDIKVYIQSIIKRQALRPSVDELLAPVRQEFANSAMTEDDLDVFMNTVRDKTYKNKQSE